MKTLGSLLFSILLFGAPGVCKIIGLVEVPSVISIREPHGSGPAVNTEKTSGVFIYQEPDLKSAKEKITRPEKFSTHEYANEREGVDVLENKKIWFLVQLRGGQGWLSAKDAGPFHSLEAILKENVYLTKDWNGQFWPDPKRTSDSRAFADRGTERLGFVKADVNVLSYLKRGDEIWVKVEILGPGRCTDRKPNILETGWVPAHASSGKLNFWFIPRGC